MNRTTGGRAATPEEVIDALERVLAGRLSREEAVTWAHSTTGAGANSPFGTWPRDRLAGFALRALLGGDASEDDLSRQGAPYFIRDADLAAWLATLRREDAVTVPVGRLRAKRPHEYRNAPFLAGLLRGAPAHLRETLGMEHIRGVDDLDFYQDLVFDEARGRQVFLAWRPTGSMPLDAEVYLEDDGGAWSEPLEEIAIMLGLGADAITWRPPAGSR